MIAENIMENKLEQKETIGQFLQLMNWNIEKSSSDPKQNIAGETDENWWFIKDVVERYASVCLNRMEFRNILIV